MWKRFLELVQEKAVELGIAFLGGTGIRAHQKAPGPQKEERQVSETCVKRLGALVEDWLPKACIVADGGGCAVAVAPYQTHELPMAPDLLNRLPAPTRCANAGVCRWSRGGIADTRQQRSRSPTSQCLPHMSRRAIYIGM